MKDIEKIIIYEDADICLCHKPAGVLSQADRGLSEDLASALMTRERRNGVKVPFIAPVNRLDRPVEGMVLYAKSSKTAALLTKQLTAGEVDKCYYAVVEGVIETKDTITLTDYLAKDPIGNLSRVVKTDTANANKAVLEYTALGNVDGKTILRVKLHTGRHHQIRVQLAHAGMPIVGDAKYNPSVATTNERLNLALCSYRLAFRHPRSGKELTYEIKPQGAVFADFRDMI